MPPPRTQLYPQTIVSRFARRLFDGVVVEENSNSPPHSQQQQLLLLQQRRRRKPLVIGMVHVAALPGTPYYNYNYGSDAATANNGRMSLLEKVRRETSIYAEAGLDGILVENMHDVPYLRATDLGPEVVACMTSAAMEATRTLGGDREKFLLGVQILAGGNEQAMAVAKAADLDFIRAECFVYSHVADEGWMDGCAGRLLRYRKHIDAEGVAILTDVKKKHAAHAVTEDVSLVECAEAALFFGADAVILTGSATGKKVKMDELRALRHALPSNAAIVLGSGVTTENVANYVEAGADALIIGSHFKQGGAWANPLDEDRVKAFLRALQ